jgi:hypothetical protein
LKQLLCHNRISSVREFTGGQLNDKTGEVKWELNLTPQQQTKLTLGYEVKYPRREKVVLE